jgi:hypothetical protein
MLTLVQPITRWLIIDLSIYVGGSVVCGSIVHFPRDTASWLVPRGLHDRVFHVERLV